MVERRGSWLVLEWSTRIRERVESDKVKSKVLAKAVVDRATNINHAVERGPAKQNE